jgi:hypothetical protein
MNQDVTVKYWGGLKHKNGYVHFDEAKTLKKLKKKLSFSTKAFRVFLPITVVITKETSWSEKIDEYELA